MQSEIINNDKSDIIPMDILNIRERSETTYQTFTNTTDKIVLKDNKTIKKTHTFNKVYVFLGKKYGDI